MRRRLTSLYALVVAGPLALLLGLAIVVAKDEREIQRERLRAAVALRVDDLAAHIESTLGQIERETLEALPDVSAGHDSLRELARTAPFIVLPFTMARDGTLTYPSGELLSAKEREFLERTRAIWSGDAILYRTPQPESSRKESPSTAQRAEPQQSLSRSSQPLESPDQGSWITWHWQEGLHLLLYRREPGGELMGAEIDRVAVLSRLVAELAERPSSTDATALPWRTALVDARGDSVANFGPLEPKGAPLVERALRYPLDSYRLRSWVDPRALGEGIFGPGILLGLVAFVLAILGLSAWIWREHDRDLRDAAQRVGFVTQVSHELKTPLTNIRLYAEMLEDEIPEEDRTAARHLGVIVSESQRLTRLIHNILTFSKNQSGTLKLHPQPVDLDETVAHAIESSAASLSEQGIELTYSKGNSGTVTTDVDAVGQIVANLLSNVEKYAAAGKRVVVKTGRESQSAFVDVRDFGPGIESRHSEAVFAPFFRIQDQLTQSASGTGIGLTIARQLARLLHGDLALVPVEGPGSCFRLTLPAPKDADLALTGDS
ncbi:MAG: HAMP domain-containing histidine kinase [Deltaproteobacteria bacterium]|nr:HAMP domain-containing histidine kinase [Deltaproteobacteria bacterium]